MSNKNSEDKMFRSKPFTSKEREAMRGESQEIKRREKVYSSLKKPSDALKTGLKMTNFQYEALKKKMARKIK